MNAPAERNGFAIVAVLLLLLALTGAAHAALLLATQERRAGGIEARLVEGRIAARAAASLPAARDTLPTLGASPVTLASGSRGGLRWRTEATALTDEIVLLVGVAETEGARATSRTGVLAGRLDPRARVAAVRAVAEVGSAHAARDAVVSDGWMDVDGGYGGDAAEFCSTELDALGPMAHTPGALAAFPPGGERPPAPPGLGLVAGDSLLRRAGIARVGGLTPRPVAVAGICVDAADNWGSPSDPSGPCGARMVHVGAGGDLELVGGEGQGVLVVAGNLRLSGEAHFHGVILVGGDLHVDAQARLVGMARVVGGLRVAPGGRVVGSACAAARALRSAPTARWPTLLAEGARVHPL